MTTQKPFVKHWICSCGWEHREDVNSNTSHPPCPTCGNRDVNLKVHRDDR